MGLHVKDKRGSIIASDSTYGRILRTMFILVGNDVEGTVTVRGLAGEYNDLYKTNYQRSEMIGMLEEMEDRGVVEHAKEFSDTFWKFTKSGLEMTLKFNNFHENYPDQLSEDEEAGCDLPHYDPKDNVRGFLEDALAAGVKLSDIVLTLSRNCDDMADGYGPSDHKAAAQWGRAAGMLEMLSVKLRRM